MSATASSSSSSSSSSHSSWGCWFAALGISVSWKRWINGRGPGRVVTFGASCFGVRGRRLRRGLPKRFRGATERETGEIYQTLKVGIIIVVVGGGAAVVAHRCRFVGERYRRWDVHGVKVHDGELVVYRLLQGPTARPEAATAANRQESYISFVGSRYGPAALDRGRLSSGLGAFGTPSNVGVHRPIFFVRGFSRRDDDRRAPNS
jgi:hypothetical protein